MKNNQLVLPGGAQRGISRGSSGRSVGNANTLRNVDQTLTQEDMARFDFVPLGHYMLAEPIAPDSISEHGVHTPYGTGDKPMYRVLRSGQRSLYPNEFAEIDPGVVVYDKTTELFSIPHNFPRSDGNRERLLLLLKVFDTLGVWKGYAWPRTSGGDVEEGVPLAEGRTLSRDMMDFQENYVEAIETKMLAPEDLGKLDLSPVGPNIIVENAPPKNLTGSILTMDNFMPLYQVLKVPEDMSSFPSNLRFLQQGDMVMISMLNRTSEIPHALRRCDNGEGRRIYLANASTIVGWYPSLSRRHRESVAKVNVLGDAVDVDESTTCSEASS
jgi:hypothetical protein